MSDRIRLCASSDLKPGSMRQFLVRGTTAIALYRIGDAFYATDDTCTHAVACLSEGELEGDVVVCPVHFGEFHVPTGKALGFPAVEDLRTYRVEQAGDDIFVRV
ncbi:non-heme iron oxygenase ferredoxin subunit [Roseiterribacter gracilis]|uniref:3-phenylpropionate/cinnamic acid dioxygenase ferredoxin subunit n=1 Tax=Roseiterribacter gracilis TaxID=2812848 RepID=A0A8S8XCX7_9PROT|nr:3-phenylpropionate/cinnamic acid dioxygenase ferredoxin subunit [Rhodospirillales bacterium TMPK1]